MRPLRSFVISAALLAAACQQAPNAPAGSAEGEFYTVRAGPIANARLTSIDGTFQLLKVAAANGIPSARLGGACIVFDPAALGFTQMAAKSCTTNSDCATPAELTGAAYCDGAAHQCWAKPITGDGGIGLCNKGMTLSPQQLNHVPATPGSAASYGVKPGARVRVVACLNKAGANLKEAGCGSVDGPDRIEVMGPVATLKE